MSRIPNEEMIQLSKEAEEKIKDGFLEIAGQIEWLALSHDVDIGNLPLHSEHWDAMYKQAIGRRARPPPLHGGRVPIGN